MKNRQAAVRIAALLSSVSIIAAYVSCRSQDAKPAEGQSTTTRGTEFMGGSKNEAIFAPSPPPPAEAKSVMGGSKSIVILKPSDLPPAAPAPTPK